MLENSQQRQMTVSCAFWLGDLLFSYKYGMKDKYFKCLEKLKPFMDKALFDFFWNFGFEMSFEKNR